MSIDSVARQLSQQALSFVENALEPVTGTVAQNLAASQSAAETATQGAETATDQAVVANESSAAATAAATTAVAADNDAQVQAASARSAASSAAVSAAIRNILGASTSAGAALPFEVTTVAGGIGTGSGGAPGTYTGGVSGGPAGFQWQYTIDATGKYAGATISNPGLSTSSAVPTLSLPAGGLTGATVPTATVASIPVGRTFYAPSADGTLLLGWGNNAGALVSAPFGTTQLALSLLDANHVIATTLKVKNLWPDTFFREIDPAHPIYPRNGKGRPRLSGTWAKVKSTQSPFETGFSLQLAAGVASAQLVLSVIDAGRALAAGDVLQIAFSASGGNQLAVNAVWIGAGGAIGSQFTLSPTTTLTMTAQTINTVATSSALTMPAGAIALQIIFQHVGTPADKFIHAIWAQKAGAPLLSDPTYRYELPADIVWRFRDAEIRANGNVALKRAAYSAAVTELAVTGGGATTDNVAFTGWGTRLAPAGISFNALAIAGANRPSGSPAWRKLMVMVRAGAAGTSYQTGTVVALGSIDLDPGVLSYGDKLIIPLRHPETDVFKTLGDTDLGAEYFCAFWCIDDAGTLTSIGRSTGSTSNIVGATGYRLQSNSNNDPMASWIVNSDLSNVTVGIEHILLTNPGDTFIPSATFASAVLALSAGDQRAAWASQPQTSYTAISTVLAANDADVSGVYPAGYSGYGARLIPAGVSFNAVRLRHLTRNPAAATTTNVPATINVVVRGGTSGTSWSTGSIVAVGSVAVDQAATDYYDVIIPLVDPATGASKTLSNSDLGAQYAIGFFALTSGGANAQLNPPRGALPNVVATNEQFLLTGATNPLSGTWSFSSPASSQPIDHVLLTGAGSTYKPTEAERASLRPTLGTLALPPKVYGVQGRELNLYLDPMAVTRQDDLVYRFQFGSNTALFFGQHQDERWTYVPTGALSQAFTVSVYERSTGRLLTSASSTLVTTPAATTSRSLKYLAVGDSVTAFATSYVNELSNLQAADANLKLNFQGSKSTNGVAHEGISGWTSGQWYAPTASGDQAQNNFYNPATGVFDYAYYLTKTSQTAADVMSYHLGINNLGVSLSDEQAEARSWGCGYDIERMIASARSVNSAMTHLVLLTIPPASHQDGAASTSGSAYSGRTANKQQRRAQIIMARELVRRFGGREGENIYVVATNLAIDTERGWPFAPAANANSRSTIQVTRIADQIHPNQGTGILQMADAIWAAFKAVFS